MNKLLATLLVGLAASAAHADLMAPAPPVVVRGTIAAVDGNTLAVTSKTGTKLTVVLAPDAKIAALSAIGIEAIQPGSFIGTAAKPGRNGTLTALEVHVFAPSMRGLGEGHRAWDLGKRSSMTNGDVGSVSDTGSVKGAKGRVIVVNYKGGQQQVTVPTSVPIVAFAEGTAAQLVVGAHIFAFTKRLPRRKPGDQPGRGGSGRGGAAHVRGGCRKSVATHFRLPLPSSGSPPLQGRGWGWGLRPSGHSARDQRPTPTPPLKGRG